MNFYSHHIGDFNNATRHLSRLERSIYRDLLELYYDSEKPLTSDFDKLARRCLVADDERSALRDVLTEFFQRTDDGYHNDRADREIAAYQRMGEGGKRGAAKRWGKGADSPPIATLSPPHAEANANHEPLTINHKPEGESKRASRIPPNFEPEPEPEAEAGIDRPRELANFRDYWTAKARDNTKLSWQATWRQWARKADRPGVNRFAKPAPNITVPGKTGPDPELLKRERDAQQARPAPASVQEFKSRLKQGATA